MMLGARTAAWSGDALPYDAEVEWLKQNVSDGCFIDTGIDSADDVGFEITISKVSNISSDNVAFGIRASSGNTRFFIGATINGLWYFGWNERTDFHTCKSGEICKFGFNFKNDRRFTLNGSQFGLVGGTYNYRNRLYFPGYAPWTTDHPARTENSNCYRFYHLTMTRGDSIVLDLKPVRIGEVGYFYDSIKNEICTNLGYENFIVGPDRVSQLRGGGGRV